MALGVAALIMALAALIVVARPRRGSALEAAPDEPGTVTVDNALLRREASDRSPAVATLRRGSRVTILAELGPWLQAKTGDGASGFISAELVERDTDRQARERRATKILSFPPVFGVVAEDAVVRLAPFASAPRAGRLARGSTVSIHAVDHDYYAFKTPDGGLAFVDSESVDLVPPDPRKPAISPESVRELKDLTVNDVAVSSQPPAPVGDDATLAPEAPEPPETSDEALEPAVLLSKVDPLYPEAARRAGVEGTVVLDALVGANGRVKEVQVLRGLPLGLSESALEAVRRWQYRPARGRSGPVASHKTVRIVFTLGG